MVYSCKYGRSSYVKSCRTLTSWFTSTINVNGLGLAYLNFFLVLMLLLSQGCWSTTNCSYSDLVDRFPWFLYQDDFSLFPSTNDSGQCLLNNTTSFMEVCEVRIKENRRMEKLRAMNTKFCRIPVLHVLTKEENDTVLMCNSTRCRQILGDVEKLDSLVEGIYCDFVSLLDTYDWQYGSSTSGDPEKCKTVYKRWLCSVYVPYYENGERIFPCGEFCDAVTEFCPFFRPVTLDTQTGEPSFLCKGE
ncbi:hypothetical protein CHS0354_007895 [Potamilus streckersoni]|uniref:Uncharacterized protein n=1 Tax=Potamilus streckersoni TaxID=2493646 RepID=A0AAE0S928_9BIVA|nr:hypothetical protein CHS0354_007895 [Potamilus streckersoni]